MGFDIVHFNLHKSFTQPHGGGGPGSGPIAVSDRIEPYLPVPARSCRPATTATARPSTSSSDRPKSIGRLRGFQGNYGAFVRSYAYICSLGGRGSEGRVRDRGAERELPARAAASASGVAEYLPVAFDRVCMHEFVLSRRADRSASSRSSTLDIAKRLLDHGFHPPTVYFPLLVDEALLIEPTETETQGDARRVRRGDRRDPARGRGRPEIAQHAPYTTPVRRLDEARRREAPGHPPDDVPDD